jgi:hypothetical protein
MINHDLDIEQLESRYAALVDRNLVAVGLGIQNLLLHFNENILGAVSEKEAEKLMKKLEDIDASQKELRLQYVLNAVRRERDAILKATDWLFMSDVVTPQKHRRIYVEYRKYLRDVTIPMRKHPDMKLEQFEHYLRRKHPEEFMDGGDHKVIIHRFTYYYKGQYDR